VPVQERLARALGQKYEVRRLLGQGGFAEVYEVWDKDLQRRLAVKVLKPDIAWSAGMLDRCTHEARAITRLNHANILAIHFVGDGEGLVYYAMPSSRAVLAELLRTRGALILIASRPDPAIARCPCLHAHESGLVHRDIKARQR
jgi:serine/threonine-protein kinase